MNLTDNIKVALSDVVVDKISRFIGLSPLETNPALEEVLSGLLGGIALNGSSIKGAESIFDLIKEKKFNQSNSFNLDSVLETKEKTSDFINLGSTFLSFIFGNKQSELEDILIRKAGLSKPIGAKLLCFLTPIALGKIAEIINSKNLDTQGLSNFFTKENKDLSKVNPELRSLFSKTKSEIKIHSIEGYQSEHVKSSTGLWKWLFPVMALLILIWILLR